MLLAKAPAGIQYSEHLEGDGAAIFVHACKLGAEGIVSKHRGHPYDRAQARPGSRSKIRRRRAFCASKPPTDGRYLRGHGYLPILAPRPSGHRFDPCRVG
jgi:hypothetical protein